VEERQHLVLMGVAGSGKTTVAGLLAQRLGWPSAEADEFHPASNVAKMAAGVPLTDDDRGPWLQAIARWIADQDAAGRCSIVTCSALKRSYRDLLRDGRPQARVVFLAVDREVLAARLAARHGHFFRASLLDSQLAALEPPAPEEGVLTVAASAPPAELVAQIISGLGLPGTPASARRPGA
jgi:gluconokinase